MNMNVQIMNLKCEIKGKPTGLKYISISYAATTQKHRETPRNIYTDIIQDSQYMKENLICNASCFVFNRP